MQLQSTFPLKFGTVEEPNFSALPSQAAVFAVYFDEAGRDKVQPYLGRTNDLRRRLRRLLGKALSDSRLLSLRGQVRRVEYSLVGSSFEAVWLLYQLNKCYFPRNYRQRLRLRPPALLKLNVGNRYPRLYPTRRISRDGSIYYGPFPSRLAAQIAH